MAWGRWCDEHYLVAASQPTRGVTVSTVFLGLDHSFVPGSAPVLWETMIFGGDDDGYQERYTSRAAAVAGHTRAEAIARGERV